MDSTYRLRVLSVENISLMYARSCPFPAFGRVRNLPLYQTLSNYAAKFAYTYKYIRIYTSVRVNKDANTRHWFRIIRPFVIRDE